MGTPPRGVVPAGRASPLPASLSLHVCTRTPQWRRRPTPGNICKTWEFSENAGATLYNTFVDLLLICCVCVATNNTADRSLFLPCGHENAQRGIHHQRHQTIAHEAAHLVEFDVPLVAGHAVHYPVQTSQNDDRKAEDIAKVHFSSLEATQAKKTQDSEKPSRVKERERTRGGERSRQQFPSHERENQTIHAPVDGTEPERHHTPGGH